MKKKTVIEMDYDELEQMVQDFYGLKEWSLCADQELGNDSSYNVDIEKEEIDDYYKRQLDRLKAGEFPCYLTPTIMTDLCNHGKLEPGSYLIQVCW